MTVKIITERSVKPERQGELTLLLRQLRIRAIQQPGYISGETLFSVDNPGTEFVISTWNSLADWRTWESHPDRLEILKKIEPLLTHAQRIAVCTES
jgi:antibiotic biosynthesis monooxygenase (ABM) superfamily enzyme